MIESGCESEVSSLAEIQNLSAAKLALAIRERIVTATDAVTACLAQIDQQNDRLKALITMNGDRALTEASVADEAIDHRKI